MKVVTSTAGFKLTAVKYQTEIKNNYTVEIQVYGKKFFTLSPVSTVDTLTVKDTGERLSPPVFQSLKDVYIVSWTGLSKLWKKEYVFKFYPEHIEYFCRIFGYSKIYELNFFPTPDRNLIPASLCHCYEIFSPEPDLLDRRYFKPMEYVDVNCITGAIPGVPRRATEDMHWIFTPAPLALGFARDKKWLSISLAVKPGEYNFNRFEYVPQHTAFIFRIPYEEYTSVNGQWESPHLIFTPAIDEYDTVRKHVAFLQKHKYIKKNVNKRIYFWWKYPIVCGWGEQIMRAISIGRETNRFARQDFYEELTGKLNQINLPYGTLIIDDKWQKFYGDPYPDPEKWTDMKSFIQTQHRKGRKVLLWYAAWESEGVPNDECIINSDGKSVAPDPTNPKYEKRIRARIRDLVSSTGYDADGFKLDFTANVPQGTGMKISGTIWGIELLKKLISIIYDETKKVKPDALIITHTANPYFIEVTDMLRLNDINPFMRNIIDVMRHRAKLARIVGGTQWLIDCDNCSAPTHDEWLNYSLHQPELGVPSLYFLTAVDGTGEKITPTDLNRIRLLWQKYIKLITRKK